MEVKSGLVPGEAVILNAPAAEDRARVRVKNEWNMNTTVNAELAERRDQSGSLRDPRSLR